MGVAKGRQDRRKSAAGPQPPSAAARPAKATGRWRLRNWRLRSKLLAVLLIPTVVALLLAGLQVSSYLESAAQLNQLAKQAQLQGTVSTLVHQAQRERDLTVRFVSANRDAEQITVLERQRKRVNDAIDALRKEMNEVGPALADKTRKNYTQVVNQLDRLTKLRESVQTSSYPEDAMLRAYSESIGSLLELGELTSTEINSVELNRLQLAIVALGRVKEQASRKRAILLDAFQQKSFAPGQQRELLAAAAEMEAGVNDFRKAATAEQRRQYDDTVTGLIVDLANDMEESSLQAADAKQSIGLAPERWDVAATLTVNLIAQVENTLIDQLKTQTARQATEVRTIAVTSSVIVLGALLVAIFLAMLVAYSLLKPLRVLRKTALEVADRRLPEAVEQILAAPNPTEAAQTAVKPVPVHTTEEIGQVARSFDAVHGEAVRLAAEQALLRDNVNSMFVNLSRRSQTLVERQLSLIDQLEQDEQDPDQLASLFELDHLATRMRRNSENLLVLAGTDLTRRLTRPVPVTEVIGAAVSEVEQYARVQVSAIPELTVQGRAVNDVVHLVAELLDNATAFSDPITKVQVRTARTRKGELAIEITDRGVGLPEQDVADVNARLAEPPEVDVAVSRRMGLFVVGRLAKRHDIRVRLRTNEDIEGGTTALVVVPAGLIQPLSDSGTATIAQSLPPATTSAPVLDTGEQASLFTRPAMPAIESGLAGEPPVTETAVELPTLNAFPVQLVSGSGEQDPGRLPQWSEPGQPVQPEPVAQQPEPDDGRFSGQCGGSPLADGADHDSADIFAVSEKQPPSAEAGQSAAGWSAVPRVPVTERHQEVSSDNGFGGGRPKGVEYDLDAPTERLPIYEAVLSQWFQAVDDAPPVGGPYRGTHRADLGFGAGTATEVASPAPAPALPATPPPAAPAPAAPPAAPVPAPTPAGRPAAPAAPPVLEPPVPEPTTTPEPVMEPAKEPAAEPAAAPAPATQPVSPPLAAQPPAAARPAPAEQEDDTVFAGGRGTEWSSPGDEGWQAAQALLSPTNLGTTSAGLPKRVPKAHLVPGSAAPRQQQVPSKAPLTTRSADAVRGRMSNFQHGLRRGRHSRSDILAGEQGVAEHEGPTSDQQESETRSPAQGRNEEQA